MIKIIFLDIDGVVATPDYLKDGQWALNPEKQEILGKILKLTGAKIVLSSSWRLHTLEDTKAKMKEEGFLFVDDIIGVTIRAYHYIDKSSKIHLSIPRGVEIQQWIDTHIHSENGKNFKRKKLGIDYQYVILDDDTDMLYTQRNNFVNTNSEKGLDMYCSAKAISILSRELVN